MLVFISWSGDIAKEVAEALRDWLRSVIQACRPWMSEQDIDAGAFWDDEIRRTLLEAKFGVVCVTASNVGAPWLNYEAGALAERLSGNVCPYLFGVRRNDLVSAPLSRLQAQHADRDGTFGLVSAINKKLGPDALPDALLLQAFDTAWPRLEQHLRGIRTQAPPARPQAEKVDEILSVVQAQSSMLLKLVSSIQPERQAPDEAFVLVEPQLQAALQQRLSETPETRDWSVHVTRFGSVFQARFAKLDGTAVVERKLKVQTGGNPTEAFMQMLTALIQADKSEGA